MKLLNVCVCSLASSSARKRCDVKEEPDRALEARARLHGGGQAKMAPRGSRMAPRAPKMATKWPQEDPERLQDSPERSQDGAQKAQNGPNRPQDASRSKVGVFFCPTWTPKGTPRAPQVGHLGPPKSDDSHKDSALFHF